MDVTESEIKKLWYQKKAKKDEGRDGRSVRETEDREARG